MFKIFSTMVVCLIIVFGAKFAIDFMISDGANLVNEYLNSNFQKLL